MDWYVGNDWKLERKGLRKVVLSLNFTELNKPSQVSKVKIKINDVQNLRDRATKYLSSEYLNKSQELQMGTSLTPVDCYLEILVQQMIVGEKSHCYIQTTGGEEISFIVILEQIIDSRQIHTLTVQEMYERAQKLKDNGVCIFKEYPKFAHDYFVRAAKCLISYKPFTNLTEKTDGIDGTIIEALFVNIQTNIAACLLAEKRYEDVIYQTDFIKSVKEPAEKSLYRRAVAFYSIKEYDKAQETIERLPNYQEKKEFVKLQQRIAESRKTSHDHYKNIVQKMFG